MISKLKGPVTAPLATANKLDAVKALLGLLKEAGIMVGAFEANDLFDVDFESQQSALSTLFENLKTKPWRRTHSFFDLALNLFMAEQSNRRTSARARQPAPAPLEEPYTLDVDMESADSRHDEYDPNDLEDVAPQRAAVSTAM
ncbi:unnamed protein product [Phytophthora lilii]|uniref:Unnamed protein product n=1 Tax=Phytophthora lilii TaxID=2077276 RepID=A0A9W6TU25_9STRA|nr:unnamed protein product [Phytophthora lilii]